MLSKLVSYFKTKNRYINFLPEIYEYIHNDRKSHKINLGQLQSGFNNKLENLKNISEVEFQVFSQWGDDGIIQYLVNKLNLPHKVFIEFGVEHYKESNTRFLLINNNFSGLVIDGDKKNIDFINADELSWSFDLHAVCSFITKDNINDTITNFLDKGYDKEIALLSIDIDGNDYWIWENINAVEPIIVIVEYNSVFGPSSKWTIPYKADFYGINEHSSRYYWGASLNAFCHLAQTKGYSLIGCNSNGNNAYFIKNEHLGNLKVFTAEEAFVEAKFRLAASSTGYKYSGKEKSALLNGMEIFDLESNKLTTI